MPEREIPLQGSSEGSGITRRDVNTEKAMEDTQEIDKDLGISAEDYDPFKNKTATTSDAGQSTIEGPDMSRPDVKRPIKGIKPIEMGWDTSEDPDASKVMTQEEMDRAAKIFKARQRVGKEPREERLN